MSVDSSLSTRGLTKFYGDQRGIEDLDLDVRPEEVFGFLGPNGAGKTTTIRMLLGLIRPSRGEATILGEPLRFGQVGRRAEIGYLPGDLALYERMTGEQLLAYLARLRGGVTPQRYRGLAERLGLDLGRRVGDLSRGNRQKVGVVQAFMHWPRLLVLDDFLTLLFCVIIPLARAPIKRLGQVSMLIPVLLIFGVVVIRFCLDLFVTSTITQGPYRIFFMAGSFYLIYFVFAMKLESVDLRELLEDFVIVSSFVSMIAVLGVIGNSWPIIRTLWPYQEYGSEVGTFARLQTTYHHFAVLAVMVCAVLMVASGVQTGKRLVFGIVAILNFWNVLISGYRANLYVLLLALALFGLYLLFQKKAMSTAWIVVIFVPMCIYGSEYARERNLQTVEDDGSDSSILYRFIEIGYGLEKMAEVDGWIFGVGYADGFNYEWAPARDQETYFLHNGYASLFYNYGIVGSVAWLTFILGVIVYVLRHLWAFRKELFYVMFGLYLMGQLAVNFSSGIFNREISATFCFLFAFSVLERIVNINKRSPVSL